MRIVSRVAAFALLSSLVSACSGGSKTVPVAPVQVPAAAALAPAAAPQSAGVANIDGVPETAPNGVQVSVHLPLRNSAALDALIQRQTDQTSSDYHRFLTPAQFRATYGPAASDVASVVSTLQGLGFTTKLTSQSVLASAPQATVEKAFGIKLNSVQVMARGTQGLRAAVASRTVLAADRAPTLPAALARVNATVAFSSLLKHVDSQLVSKTPFVSTPANRYSSAGPYWFDDLKQAYGYPAVQTADGAGRTIAIVIDSQVSSADTAAYFEHEGVRPPRVEYRPVDGGAPAFSIDNDGAFEASLDVQQSGGSALGATIEIYGVPELSDQDVDDAYQAIVDDDKADVVSSSFGLCELYYTAAYTGGEDFTYLLQEEHDIFRQGNAEGITFVAASGDYGAYECVDPSETFLVKGVDSPADDTDVTAVGGTNLTTKSNPPSLTSAYVSEEAFYDLFTGGIPNNIWGSGGGVSTIFPKPFYQLLQPTGANTRTVPDVAMHMGGCPEGAVLPCNPADSSDVAAVDGDFYLLIGTSASSPEFAGLLAVTEQHLGTRLGNANGYIYALAAIDPSLFYHRGIPGNNGYPTNGGYDYVLGNGTPKASAFALSGGPLAGIPGSPTNP